MQTETFSPAKIKELLQAHRAAPSKLLGQHFLVNQKTLEAICDAANLNAQDTVVEVGPGLGQLTRLLAERANKVIAIEKDRAMVNILKETLADFKNVEVITGNALAISNFKLKISNYKVVANIPYYLTSALIRMFLEQPPHGIRPQTMVLTIQKEVALRIAAKPPRMSLLSVAVQYYASAKIVRTVPREQFWPRPKVDSAVIRIAPLPNPPNLTEAAQFFKIVKAGFSQPRKQIANNLSAALKQPKETVLQWLQSAHIDPSRRPGTLTIEEWKGLG